MLSKIHAALEGTFGSVDQKYLDILRKANSAHPTKYPLLELELVMRELFQEDKLIQSLSKVKKLEISTQPVPIF